MLKRFCRNSLAILVLIMCCATTVFAARPEKTEREPVMITSNSMQADKIGDTVTFSGDVTLKKKGMTLTSDSLIVFYDTRSRSIRKIDAYGNVVVRQENRTAFSHKASYYSKEEKIVLSGEARILEDENELGGDTITLFIRDDRSVVEGGKVLFYQNKQNKSEEGKP
ncbi:MAG: lipopolysaccharide transport periplasmic protein LptA [Nitrospirota bacterium]